MDIDQIRRDNIKQLAAVHGPALAKRAGMSPAQFYNLRDGAADSKTGKPRGMRKETAWRLEDAAGVERGWLDVAHSGPQEMDSSSRSIPQYNAAGAMGNGGLVLDEQPPGIIKSWQVDEQWLRMNVPAHTGVANLCIVTGFGSSMQPMFNPGDPLLMDRGVTDCRSDGVYFFRVGDHGWIKQLQRIPTASGMVIRAKSKNSDYDPFDITEGMDFHVLGKILLAWRSDRV